MKPDLTRSPCLLAGVAILAILIAMLIGATDEVLDRSRAVENLSGENLNQVGAENEIKFWRLYTALDNYRDDPSDPALSEVKQATRNFEKHLQHLQSGKTGEEIRKIGGLPENIAKLFPLVRETERLLNKHIEFVDLQEMQEYAEPIHRISVKILDYERERTKKLIRSNTEIYDRILWYIAAILTISAILGAMLVKATGSAQEANAKLLDAIESIPDGFAIFGKDHRLIIANDQYRMMSAAGYDFITPGVRYPDIIRKSVKNGFIQNPPADLEGWITELEGTRISTPLNIELHCSNGTWLRLAERRTAAGRLVVIKTDITELKEREQALTISEERFQLAVEGANEGIWDWNIETDELYLSPRLRQTTGIDECTAYTMESWKELIFADDLKGFTAALDEHCKGRTSTFKAEYRLRHSAGGHIWIASRALAARRSDGTPYRVTGSLSDVSQHRHVQTSLRIAKEEAEQASLAKSQFLAVMSHEIRTPMNGILGMLELLENSPISRQQREHIGIAKDSAQGLLNIINEILDFSKLEAGRVTLNKEPCSIVKEMQSVISLLEQPARNKGISLSLCLAEHIPTQIVTDVGRIKQILLNLLNNAIKFTAKGSVTLSVRTAGSAGKSRALGNNATALRFEVTDTGSGIRKEDRENLFKHFSQLDTSYTRKHGGTGLGLAICRRLTQLMDGHIDFSSTPGEGSTFWVEIPCETISLAVPVSAGPGGTARPDSPSHTAKGSGRDEPACQDPSTGYGHILLAEDIPTNQLLTRTHLEHAGFKVDCVKTGKEAVKALEDFPYDAVLMDIAMPEMDGLTAIRIIRSWDNERRRTPIAAMTAFAMEEDRERCIAAGADGYISKPVLRDALISATFELVKREPRPTPAQEGGAALVKPPAAQEIVNTEILNAALEDLEPSMVSAAIETFIKESSQISTAIIAAIDDCDCESIAREAHGLRSAAGQLGARNMQTVAEAIEAAATEQNMRCLSILKGELRTSLDLTSTQIGAELAKRLVSAS